MLQKTDFGTFLVCQLTTWSEVFVLILKTLLFASVSSLTMALGSQAVRGAEEGKFIFGLVGSSISGENATIDAFEQSGLYDLVDIERPGFGGMYFAMMVGSEVMPLWDVRATVAMTSATAKSADFTYFDGSTDKLGSLDTGLDYQTLDLEAGYTPALSDNFQLRLVAGVRAMHLRDRLAVEDKIGSDQYENEFVGVGPRLALDASTRFGATPFGVSGSAGGGLLLGRLERSTNAVADEPVDKSISTLDAKVTLDYHLTENARLSLGYRAETLYGAHDFLVDGTALQEDQSTHGPVLEFLGKF